MARICDALPLLSFFWPPVSAQDHLRTAPLHECHAGLSEHAQARARRDDRVPAAREVRRRDGDGGGRLDAERRRRPPICGNICTISPLAHDAHGLECALTYAEAGIPFSFMAMPTMGSTAPATELGAIVEGRRRGRERHGPRPARLPRRPRLPLVLRLAHGPAERRLHLGGRGARGAHRRAARPRLGRAQPRRRVAQQRRHGAGLADRRQGGHRGRHGAALRGRDLRLGRARGRLDDPLPRQGDPRLRGAAPRGGCGRSGALQRGGPRPGRDPRGGPARALHGASGTRASTCATTTCRCG